MLCACATKKSVPWSSFTAQPKQLHLRICTSPAASASVKIVGEFTATPFLYHYFFSLQMPPLGTWVHRYASINIISQLVHIPHVPLQYRFGALYVYRCFCGVIAQFSPIINIKIILTPNIMAYSAFVMSLQVCRLHTAFLHWPLSSAATKEVQGPDTT